MQAQTQPPFSIMSYAPIPYFQRHFCIRNGITEPNWNICRAAHVSSILYRIPWKNTPHPIATVIKSLETSFTATVRMSHKVKGGRGHPPNNRHNFHISPIPPFAHTGNTRIFSWRFFNSTIPSPRIPGHGHSGTWQLNPVWKGGGGGGQQSKLLF